jgi:hypothetical protein
MPAEEPSTASKADVAVKSITYMTTYTIGSEGGG